MTTFFPNTYFVPDQRHFAKNLTSYLVFQRDGNLVLYRNNGQPVWASGTWNVGATTCVLQTDGNLVIYNAAGGPLWSSGTHGHPQSTLVVQNDGNLVIYEYGHPLWASNTYAPHLLAFPDFSVPTTVIPEKVAPPAGTPPVTETKSKHIDEPFKEEDFIQAKPVKQEKEKLDLSKEELSTKVTKQRNVLVEQDVDRIYKACKGFGTDDQELIHAICSRAKKAHLQLVDEEYFKVHKMRLRDVIESECSGDYKRFLISVVTPSIHAKVTQLEKATSGLGTNEKVIIELAVGSSAEELTEIKKVWDSKGGKPLIDMLKNELSGDFEKLIVQLMCTPRPETTTVDESRAEKDAEALHKAAKGFGCDVKTFISILGTSSNAQIQAIKNHYERKQGKSLKSLIESEMSSHIEKAFVGLLFPSREAFLAHELFTAMDGVGTNEDPIVRILGSNDKGACRLIAEAYYQQTNVRLQDALKKEMSTNVANAMIAWISAEDPDGELQGKLKEHHELVNTLPEAIAFRDAQSIRDATKGWGTNEDSLIQIICSRTKRHLYDVDLAYREHFGTSLPKLIDSECSGDFKKILRYIVMSEEIFDVYLINKACQGLGTNEALLIEVFATTGPKRLAKAKAKFELSGKSLVDLISSELSGDFKELCLTLLAGRSEAEANEQEASDLAEQIHRAGVGRLGTDEKKFIKILGKSSVKQCQAISKAYESKYQCSLESAIDNELGGDFKDALLAIICDPIDYSCRVLHKALTAWNTDESAIARVLGGNDKPTLKLINDRYFKKFDIRLKDHLNKELSGNYKVACVFWLELEGFP